MVISHCALTPFRQLGRWSNSSSWRHFDIFPHCRTSLAGWTSARWKASSAACSPWRTWTSRSAARRRSFWTYLGGVFRQFYSFPLCFQIFREMDSNGDGRINKKEFVETAMSSQLLLRWLVRTWWPGWGVKPCCSSFKRILTSAADREQKSQQRRSKRSSSSRRNSGMRRNRNRGKKSSWMFLSWFSFWKGSDGGFQIHCYSWKKI